MPASSLCVVEVTNTVLDIHRVFLQARNLPIETSKQAKLRKSNNLDEIMETNCINVK